MQTASDNRPFRIHFCHTTGPESIVVEDLVATMEGVARRRLHTRHSSQFTIDRHWQAQVSASLERTDWLVLLLSGASCDRDWWLWEAGYFAGCCRERPGKVLCIHDPSGPVPMPLRACELLPATREGAAHFLRRVFVDPPLALRPELFMRELQPARDRMVELLGRCCRLAAA